MKHIWRAAILQDGEIHVGWRHCNIIWALAASGHRTPIDGKQGFVTNEFEFVGREVGALIALHAGQISGWRRRLFSEDLY